MSLDRMQNVLSAALREAGLPDALFSPSAMAETEVHGLRIALEYLEEAQSLVLYCSVGALPAAPSPELYGYLLGANLMGRGTGGGHLGLGPERLLIFSMALSAQSLDGPRLVNAFDRFAEKAAELIADVQERGSSPAVGLDASSMLNALWV